MRSGPARLAILASHPIQYFTPVYRLLASHPGLEVEVFFCRDFGVRPRFDKQFGQAIQWDVDLLDGYPHRFLANLSPIRDTFNPLHAINPGAFAHLLRGFDALWVNGYLYPSNWFAALAASIRGTKLLLRSELRNEPRRARPRNRVRDRIVRAWVAHSDALLFIGEENRAAYLSYGASREKLFFTPYSVDVERHARAARGGERRRAELRARWGIAPDAVVVLFVGKLTPRKHPEAALTCATLQCDSPVHVMIAGSGPMKDTLHSAAATGATRNATFTGFVNQRELPDIYALSDVFIMPSEREPWGLVLNEAMAAGLAPVVSRDVGAAADLVRHGDTGFVFESRDWNGLHAHVRNLVNDPSLRRRIGAAAQVQSLKYSYAATTDGVLGALASVGVLADAHSAGVRTPVSVP